MERINASELQTLFDNELKINKAVVLGDASIVACLEDENHISRGELHIYNASEKLEGIGIRHEWNEDEYDLPVATLVTKNDEVN